MTRDISCHESSCLANCRLVCVWSQSMELLFVPVASALTGTHRDYLTVVSFGQEPDRDTAPCISRSNHFR